MEPVSYFTRSDLFQVLGRHERGLHPHAERQPDRHHDCGGVVGGAGRLTGPPVRLEGSRLPRPHQPAAALPREPGRRLSDIRHLLYVLRPSARDPRALLEDLPDGEEADSQATSAKNDDRCEHHIWRRDCW